MNQNFIACSQEHWQVYFQNNRPLALYIYFQDIFYRMTCSIEKLLFRFSLNVIFHYTKDILLCNYSSLRTQYKKKK